MKNKVFWMPKPPLGPAHIEFSSAYNSETVYMSLVKTITCCLLESRKLQVMFWKKTHHQTAVCNKIWDICSQVEGYIFQLNRKTAIPSTFSTISTCEKTSLHTFFLSRSMTKYSSFDCTPYFKFTAFLCHVSCRSVSDQNSKSFVYMMIKSQCFACSFNQ